MPDAFFSAPKQRKRKRTDSGVKPPNKKFASRAQDGRKPGSTTTTNSNSKTHTKPTNSKRNRDDELSDHSASSDGGDIDDMDLRAPSEPPSDSGEEDEDETPAEKRLRLAQLYLDSVKTGLAEGEFDAAEVDRELISKRLRMDVLEGEGKVHLFVADEFDFTTPPRSILRARGHRLSVTSAVASESLSHLYTASKDGHILAFSLSTGQKLHSMFKVRPPVDADALKSGSEAGNGKSNGKTKGKGKAPDESVPGHTDEVLALAVSGDGEVLVSGGRDRRLCVWDREGRWVRTFAGHLGHKDAVVSLAFKKHSLTLYTSSADRTLKLYDLSPAVMGYVETLFGHQDHVLSLDALRGDTCVSVGGRDKTVRYWKIGEETQLVFRGGGRSRVREMLEGGLRGDDDDEEDEDMEGEKTKMKTSNKGKARETKFVEGAIECVAMVDETTFVSGGDSGSLCLWTTTKKKPIFTQALAHGLADMPGGGRTPRWVTAVAALRYSDLFVSGSYDSTIRIWKLDAKLKSFALVGTVHAPGVVNSLQLLAAPRTWGEGVTWVQGESTSTTISNTTSTDPPTAKTIANTLTTITTGTKKLAANPIVLVAGLGQEHRLGRWLRVPGSEGARNEAIVVLFRPVRR